MPYHLQALILGGGNDAVSLLNQPALHPQAQWRFRCVGICELFQMRQCVEHGNMRDVPVLRKLHASYARKPVMTMQYAVLYPLIHAKSVNPLCEAAKY